MFLTANINAGQQLQNWGKNTSPGAEHGQEIPVRTAHVSAGHEEIWRFKISGLRIDLCQENQTGRNTSPTDTRSWGIDLELLTSSRLRRTKKTKIQPTSLNQVVNHSLETLSIIVEHVLLYRHSYILPSHLPIHGRFSNANAEKSGSYSHRLQFQSRWSPIMNIFLQEKYWAKPLATTVVVMR